MKNIRHRHPLWPGKIFDSEVLTEGEDGATVRERSTGQTLAVRKEDLGEQPLVMARKSRETLRELARRYPSMPAAQTKPSTNVTVGGKIQHKTSPITPVYPYETGHDVHYQRPNMPTPKIGRIIKRGETGAMIGLPGTEGVPVRWADVLGRASLKLKPEEGLDAAHSLAEMGVPIDETQLYMQAEGRRGPTRLHGLLQALHAEGVPLDLKRIADAPEKKLQKLLARLTEDDADGGNHDEIIGRGQAARAFGGYR